MHTPFDYQCAINRAETSGLPHLANGLLASFAAAHPSSVPPAVLIRRGIPFFGKNHALREVPPRDDTGTWFDVRIDSYKTTSAT